MGENTWNELTLAEAPPLVGSSQNGTFQTFSPSRTAKRDFFVLFSVVLSLGIGSENLTSLRKVDRSFSEVDH